MTNRDTTMLGLDQEDRLPWLEAGETYDAGPRVAPGRLVALVLAALAILGALAAGIWWLTKSGGRSAQSEVIAAPPGDYKVVPADPDAKVFEGEGDASFAASDGSEPVGQLGSGTPGANEAPIAVAPAPTPPPAAAGPGGFTRTAPAAGDATGFRPGVPATQPTPAKPVATIPAKPVTTAPVAPKPVATPPKPVATAPTPAAPKPVATPPKPVASAPAPAPAKPAATTGGSGLVQLGAFSSQAAANKAWSRLSGRFSYLSGASHQIVPTTANGATVYRLRARTGDASGMCSKLKVAGESCMVVK